MSSTAARSTTSAMSSVAFRTTTTSFLFGFFVLLDRYSERTILGLLSFYLINKVFFSFKVLIVNFGGIVFSVVRLDLEHWMWCILFGVGSILWGQLVICIPTVYFKRFIFSFRFCFPKRSTTTPNSQPMNSAVNQDPGVVDEDYLEDDKRNDEEIEKEIEEGFLNSPDVMWLRGANRIASQHQVVQTYQQKLDEDDIVLHI